jgi:hypothetical protein
VTERHFARDEAIRMFVHAATYRDGLDFREAEAAFSALGVTGGELDAAVRDEDWHAQRINSVWSMRRG